MPIFSNRSLAAMLRDLPQEVRERCQEDLLGRLATEGYTALSAEWELFALRQMAVGGALKLAPAEQPGVPDAIFTAPGHSPVVVEITALNDQDLVERFSDDALGLLFYRAVYRLTKRTVGAFDVHTSWPVGERGLPAAGLPPRSQLHAFMRQPDVQAFVRAVASAPEEARRLEHRVGDSITTVTFRPGDEFSSGSAAGFSARGFNEHNRSRLFKKLGKKARQFKLSSLQMPSVLILCDADCQMLGQHALRARSAKSAISTIYEFISGTPTLGFPHPNGPLILQRGSSQQTTTINAVLILTVEEDWRVLSGERSRRLLVSVIRNESIAKHSLYDEALQALVKAISSNVPQIRRTPVNAKNPLRWPENDGGYRASGSRVKLSLLAFQDLLAGRTTREDFAARNDVVAEYIERFVAQGRCLSNVRIYKDPDSDDDWIEFDFDGIDPRNLRQLAT